LSVGETQGGKQSPALVELVGAGFRYGEDVVLPAVDLSVAAGDRVVLLGPNGGGKTTVVRLLLGLLAPWRGRRGVGVAAGGRAPRLGYVPQFPAFDRAFPVRVAEMVLQGRLRDRPLGRPFAGADRRAAEELLERLGLTGLRDAYLTELSGGELKRALIARALVSRPDLLALDEPSASLDEASRRAFWGLVGELPPTTAVVLATHDLAPGTFAPTGAFLVDGGIEPIAIDGLHGHPMLCGHGHG
jgi:zinc transport system ATP-binding protein